MPNVSALKLASNKDNHESRSYIDDRNQRKRVWKARRIKMKEQVLELMEQRIYSYAEIAKKMGVKIHTVMRLTAQAEKELNKRLGQNVDVKRGVLDNDLKEVLRRLWIEYNESRLTSKGKVCRGNVAILAQIADVTKQRAELWGLNRQTNIDPMTQQQMIDWQSIIFAQKQLAQLAQHQNIEALSQSTIDPIEEKIRRVSIATEKTMDKVSESEDV